MSNDKNNVEFLDVNAKEASALACAILYAMDRGADETALNVPLKNIFQKLGKLHNPDEMDVELQKMKAEGLMPREDIVVSDIGDKMSEEDKEKLAARMSKIGKKKMIGIVMPENNWKDVGTVVCLWLQIVTGKKDGLKINEEEKTILSANMAKFLHKITEAIDRAQKAEVDSTDKTKN